MPFRLPGLGSVNTPATLPEVDVRQRFSEFKGDAPSTLHSISSREAPAITPLSSRHVEVAPAPTRGVIADLLGRPANSDVSTKDLPPPGTPLA